MAAALKLVKTFANEPAALIAKAILDANDIPSIVVSDGASGINTQLMVQGVRLSVREEDFEVARELLAEA